MDFPYRHSTPSPFRIFLPISYPYSRKVNLSVRYFLDWSACSHEFLVHKLGFSNIEEFRIAEYGFLLRYFLCLYVEYFSVQRVTKPYMYSWSGNIYFWNMESNSQRLEMILYLNNVKCIYFNHLTTSLSDLSSQALA